MDIKAVIFDLDGTITAPFFDFDMIRKEMGLTQNDGPVWEAMKKMSPDRRRRTKEILDFHENQAVIKSTLNTGARKTLDALQNAGIPIGILTRNKKANALAIEKMHGLTFDAVIGREDGPVKPDAFGVLSLCSTFNVKSTQTLVVGDYLYDLLSAKAANAVAVLLTSHKKANEFTKHADFVINNVEQILEIIDNID